MFDGLLNLYRYRSIIQNLRDQRAAKDACNTTILAETSRQAAEEKPYHEPG